MSQKRVYRYRFLHQHVYENNKIIVRLQNTKAIVQSSKRQCVKIEEYIFLLKIYKVIANETNNNKTKKLCKKR